MKALDAVQKEARSRFQTLMGFSESCVVYVFTLRSFGVTNGAVIIGELIFFEALIISLIRGTPNVIFIEATPAK